jgi:hypothetical protein
VLLLCEYIHKNTFHCLRGIGKFLIISYQGPDMLNSRENHFEALSCPDHNNDVTTANTIGPIFYLSDDQNFVPNRALWIFSM